MDQAVRPFAVGERGLEGIARRRQPVLDDGFHAALAERTACLLVGQDALQAGDLCGQGADVLLRGVDHREPGFELRQLFGRGLRAEREVLADALADRVETFGQAFLNLRSRVGEIVADALQPPEHLDLRAHQLIDLLLGAGMPLQLGLRLEPALAAGAQEQRNDDRECEDACGHWRGDRKAT